MMRVIPVLCLSVNSVRSLNLELMMLSSDIVSAHDLFCRACNLQVQVDP